MFNYWKAVSLEERFYLENKNHLSERLTVYTKRSLKREAKLLNNYIQEFTKPPSVFIWVSPFHKEIFSLLSIKFPARFIWICIQNFSPNFSGHPSVFFTSNQLEEKMRTISQNASLKVDFHSSLQTLSSLQAPDYLNKLKKCIQDMIYETVVRLKTIKHFEKIWEYNFKVNQKSWREAKPINKLNVLPPDTFILGGPSVDEAFKLKKLKKPKDQRIWSADTALTPLVTRNILPEVIFSIDAGFASFEHYIYLQKKQKKQMKSKLVLDPFSFPKYYKIGLEIYTYANSNPLIQEQSDEHDHLDLVNDTGDVFGLMVSAYQILFPEKKLPVILGRDRAKNLDKNSYVTHLRGSAYHLRRYHSMNRLDLPEKYFYSLSKRFN